jgi:hypothetical protein
MAEMLNKMNDACTHAFTHAHIQIHAPTQHAHHTPNALAFGFG